MGWCLLDRDDPSRVLYVSREPALAPEAPYEIEAGPIPQVDMRNFPTGVRVVFPEGMVRRGNDLVVYYGAADARVGGARVDEAALLASIEAAIAAGDTGT
jgi:beta-1,4-mannooligosaccharide/beta-1,4-mannosyl-N-acetylglucosamine phosphorylase